MTTKQCLLGLLLLQNITAPSIRLMLAKKVLYAIILRHISVSIQGIYRIKCNCATNETISTSAARMTFRFHCFMLFLIHCCVTYKYVTVNCLQLLTREKRILRDTLINYRRILNAERNF